MVTGLNRQADRERVADCAIFALLLIVFCAANLLLFYRQCVYNMQDAELYHADMKAYILEMQGLNDKYSFPYPILFRFAGLLNLFTSPELAMALAVMVLNALAVVTAKVALNKMTLASLEEAFPHCRWAAGLLTSAAATGLFLVSMLFPPDGIYLPGIRFRYVGVLTPNPFHNATYMAARPFALLAFIWFVKLLETYEKGAARRDYVLFSLFLLASTMTKPSFTIVLAGVAGLIMLYRLIRQRCHNLKQTILFGVAFVPTFLALLYQFCGVFVPEEGAEGGIGFCFGRIWALYCDNIPLAICLAAGFPILALLLNYKKLKTDTLYRRSWQVYGMSFAMAFFLYEKGFREPDFNFSWSYMYGLFFLFFGTLKMLLQETAQRRRPALLILQWLAFLWHLLCGAYYFYGIFLGKTYY